MTKQQQAKLANEIVNRLFSNGEGESAKRLVLELEDGRNGECVQSRLANDKHILITGGGKD